MLFIFFHPVLSTYRQEHFGNFAHHVGQFMIRFNRVIEAAERRSFREERGIVERGTLGEDIGGHGALG